MSTAQCATRNTNATGSQPIRRAGEQLMSSLTLAKPDSSQSEDCFHYFRMIRCFALARCIDKHRYPVLTEFPIVTRIFGVASPRRAGWP